METIEGEDRGILSFVVVVFVRGRHDVMKKIFACV